MKNSFYKRILYMFLGSKFDSTKPPNCQIKGGVGEPVFIIRTIKHLAGFEGELLRDGCDRKLPQDWV